MKLFVRKSLEAFGHCGISGWNRIIKPDSDTIIICDDSRDSEKTAAVSPTCIASSAKDIAIEETVKTLKTSLGPNKDAEDTNTSG